MRQGNEAVKTFTVTSDGNGEGPFRAEKPHVKCMCVIKMMGWFPCAVARAVSPLYTELKATSGGQAFVNNAVHGIFRSTVGRKGPGVIRRVSGSKAMRGHVTNTVT